MNDCEYCNGQGCRQCLFGDELEHECSDFTPFEWTTSTESTCESTVESQMTDVALATSVHVA